MNADDIRLIVDQALVIIENFYVHLPLKRAMYAVNPAERLRRLRERADTIRTADFHREMVAIFKQLRDLHTNYILPEPFRSRLAFLPFELGEYWEGEERQYVVTRIKPGFETRSFKPGVQVTHWNGTPIARAIELNADREAGNNTDARLAQGLATLTQRAMKFSLPPDELWVTLTYRSNGRDRNRRFEWLTFKLQPGAINDPLESDSPASALLGLDAQGELERQARKLLFDPEGVDVVRKATAAGSVEVGATGSGDDTAIKKLPGVFSFRTVTTSSGTFGYIRIHTFQPPKGSSALELLFEFERILQLLPQNGLILDVRKNGGGEILAGERLLQTLTPRRIVPERFHFITSPLTLQICQNPEYEPWLPSLRLAPSTGAEFSEGFPLRPEDDYNRRGQKYQGPVVLVIDPRCYSTTDMFAAGFQDHEIGKILGTGERSGAGGANVWTHADLLKSFPGPNSPIKPLPGGASFSFAVRRCTRVGHKTGRLLEDVGVDPDKIHRLTKEDLLENDVDLLNRAGAMLKEMPVRQLTAVVKNADGVKTAVVQTKNINRLDVLLDDRPYQTLDVVDGSTTINLSQLSPNATRLQLNGYEGRELVVSTRLAL